MNKTTTEEFITLLQNNPPLSVTEISKLLNLTKADIRYQIGILSKMDKIKILPPENSSKPGRPAHRYTLANHGYPDNLIDILLAFIQYHQDDSNLINELASIISSQFNEEIKTAPSLIQKINLVLEDLNRRAYQARWEISNTGPVIYFSNCPYKRILSRFPQMCEIDRLILNNLTNRDILEKNTMRSKNSRQCRFLIN